MTGNSKSRYGRALAVFAMQTLVEMVNNEDYINPWLWGGVADGDISTMNTDIDGELASIINNGYVEDDTFSGLMGLFLDIMSYAKEDGGLYCGGITSKTKEV